MVKDLVNYLLTQQIICDVYYFDEVKELEFSCKIKKISFFECIDFIQYDIIHSHLFRPDLYCAVHRRAIKKTSNTKVITTIHTAIYDDLAYTMGKLISSLIVPIWAASWKRIDHVVLLNTHAKKYYQHIKFNDVTVIPNGRHILANTDPVAPEDILLIESLKIVHTLLGTVCMIDKRKGLEQVISLLKRPKDYAFLIVGDGSVKAELEEIALLNEVASRFKIIGFRKNGHQYLQNLDLFVMLSRSEGMSLSLLEAMALKKPIVCAKIPSNLNILTQNEASFFDLDDTDGLQEACERSLQNKNELINNAYMIYEKFHMASLMGERYCKLYESFGQAQ
jgi:glycosyltransferase involved in cell wall biosynthesis